jgi:hypothetical protein
MLARTPSQFGIRRLNVRSKQISARDTQDAGDAIHPPRDCCFTHWGSAPWDCHTSQCNKLTGCFRSSNLTGGDNQDLDACHALGPYKPVIYSGRRYLRNPLPHDHSTCEGKTGLQVQLHCHVNQDVCTSVCPWKMTISTCFKPMTKTALFNPIHQSSDLW